MRAVRTGALIGVAVSATLLAINVVNCASATTITLDVRTKSSLCNGGGEGPKLNQTGIAVTTPEKVDDSNKSSLQEIQAKCKDDSGEIGTLVITPSGDKNATIAVRIVAALGDKSAGQCDSDHGDGCIIAHREIQFVEGANVPYTVVLDPACDGVLCPAGYECTGLNQCTLRSQISDDGGTKPPDPDQDTGPTQVTTDGTVIPQDTGAPIDSGSDACATCFAHNATSCTGGNTCTFDCSQGGGAACSTNSNPCSDPRLSCTFLCKNPNDCANSRCMGAVKCDYQCTGNAACSNIGCDGGTCNIDCKAENACSNLTLTATTNTVACALENGKASCAGDYACLPGKETAPPTSCARDCQGDNNTGCAANTNVSCDAGSCTKVEINDGGDGGPQN